jgi:indolepyruvate ferredoxin oxidoreductase alpha subunit
MTREAFDLSEKLGIPVMIRMVTRLSHSRSRVMPHPPRDQNALKYGEGTDWTLLPVHARRRFKILVNKQQDLVNVSNRSGFNALQINPKNAELGIIASGIAYNYVCENYPDTDERPSLLKLTTYPIPEEPITKLVDHVDTVLVVEEGYPFIEKSLSGVFGIPGKTIHGKLSGHLPATGELSPGIVRQGLGVEALETRQIDDFPLATRPPQLCQGCSHADTYRALNEALKSYPEANVFSDIGCYTLGALPPYNAIQSCVCMGASVSMAKGGAEAGVYPAVAVIGDSTFAHSGLTPLLAASAADTDMTVFILDNATVAMTGGQPTFLSGEKLEKVIEGMGVAKEHVRTIIPLPKNHDENIRIMKQEFDHRGLSVIIASRECVQQARRRKRSNSE